MGDLIWSFSPWVLFLLATRFTSLSGAIALGLVAALVVAARAIGHHHLHLLDVASVVYFAGLGLALEMVHPVERHLLVPLRTGRRARLPDVIVLGSVVIGRPFTESYARETTPKELWGTPQFRAVNRQISLVWGLAFLVGTISLIIAGSVDRAAVPAAHPDPVRGAGVGLLVHAAGGRGPAGGCGRRPAVGRSQPPLPRYGLTAPKRRTRRWYSMTAS